MYIYIHIISAVTGFSCDDIYIWPKWLPILIRCPPAGIRTIN